MSLHHSCTSGANYWCALVQICTAPVPIMALVQWCTPEKCTSAKKHTSGEAV